MNSLSRYIYGRKVAIIPQGEIILNYPFNGNFNDISSKNNHGLNSGNLGFVAGKNAGTQALNFSLGTVLTTNVLPINSNKLGISFWIKTAQTNGACVYVTGSGFNSGDFSCFVNDQVANNLESAEAGENGYNIVNVANVLTNTWKHVAININRDLNGNESQTIYINGVLATKTQGMSADNNANFRNDILNIGSRYGGINFNGSLQYFKIYNRNLTISEINQFYNE